MTPDTFYALTPAEFIYAWVGWIEHQESLLKQQWELERWSVWITTSIQLDRKNRLPLSQMFPLPWDTPTTQTQELTMEERRLRTQQILKSIRNEKDNNCGNNASPDGFMQSPETDAADGEN